ncbi:MAG: hypothetical protein H6Q69_971 [Firmicutes bacterium]|nr:hypothetical protein [Bacillota bacterium]
MSFFNPTPDEIENMQRTEETITKQAAVELENEIKNKHEIAERERYEQEHYKHRDDMLGGLLDSIGNGIERWFMEARHQIIEYQHEKELQESLKRLEDRLEQTISDSRSIAELERKTAATKRLFEQLDKDLQHKKGDTSNARLHINNNIEQLNQILEQTKKNTNKEQFIFLTRENLHRDIHSSIERIQKSENTTELKITNAEMSVKTKEMADELKEKSKTATEKLRNVYTKSTEWEKHEKYNPEKYFYKEPAHLFKGLGIPKTSQSGQKIAELIAERNQAEKELITSNRLSEKLSKVPPTHEYKIDLKKNEDFFEKIHETVQKTVEHYKKQPEQAHEMSH